jgi:hypothetical protein
MQSMADEARQTVRAWCDTHRNVALYDDESATVLDVASGKSTHLPWIDLTRYQVKIHPETGGKYIVMLWNNGTQIALVDPGGVAFAPVTANTGAVPNIPPVVCLRDYFTLKTRMDHYLFDHRDEAPPREVLDMVMICIATLDGARAIGFDVADLEGELEKSLSELERRTA